MIVLSGEKLTHDSLKRLFGNMYSFTVEKTFIIFSYKFVTTVGGGGEAYFNCLLVDEQDEVDRPCSRNLMELIYIPLFL